MFFTQETFDQSKLSKVEYEILMEQKKSCAGEREQLLRRAFKF